MNTIYSHIGSRVAPVVLRAMFCLLAFHSYEAKTHDSETLQERNFRTLYQIKSVVSEKGGLVYVVPNVDDDDGDGKRDFEDTKINGPKDLNDLSKVPVDGFQGRIQIIGGNSRLRFFSPSTGRVLPQSESSITVSGEDYILVEAKSFASKSFNGRIQLNFLDGKYSSQISRRVTIKVCPFIMLASSNRSKRVYIATGHRNYQNQRTIQSLREVLNELNVPLSIHNPWGGQNGSGQFHEMWLQDALEIGYTQRPGQDPMWVALGGLRRTEKFYPKLLGEDYGYIQIGKYRPLGGGDQWADWMGNLEVSPPTGDYPMGRIYYGINSSSGVGMQNSVVEFLKAQKVQAPFSIDTGWLTIKHVDEILNFVRTPQGSYKLIIASPQTAGSMSSGYNSYNQSIQRRLDRTLSRTLSALGFPARDVIKLPVLFKSGHNIWSNPVNSIFVNGTQILGKTDMPSTIQNWISDTFDTMSIKTRFIDDRRYQYNYGNIHCATNIQKLPLSEPWWDHFGESPEK